MIFHVCGLPHIPTSKAFPCCAYGQKVVNFCKMMKSLGHTVYLYAPENSVADCTTYFVTITEAEQTKLLEKPDPTKIPNLKWEPNEPIFALSNTRTVDLIKSHIQPKDFVVIVGGTAQEPIAKGFPNHICVEPFIGYYGTFSKYRVFESYTHMATVLGESKQNNIVNFQNAVVPNYYDLTDFTYQPQKRDYLLFVGRLTKLKGVNIAVMAAEAAGTPLKIAGQGFVRTEGNRIICKEYEIENKMGLVEYIGVLDFEQRNKWMGSAKAVLMPTRYSEPFGGVAVEAQLVGTPVISTDHAAFSETIEHGKTGFRCRTLKQWVAAIQAINQLSPEYIRARAVGKYSTEIVKYQFQEYFNSLWDLWDQGWFELGNEICNLEYSSCK